VSDGKILFDDLFVLQYLFHNILILNGPFFDDIAPFGRFPAEAHVLIPQKDGDSGIPDLLDGIG
jgi:hypothetical protein